MNSDEEFDEETMQSLREQVKRNSEALKKLESIPDILNQLQSSLQAINTKTRGSENSLGTGDSVATPIPLSNDDILSGLLNAAVETNEIENGVAPEILEILKAIDPPEDYAPPVVDFIAKAFNAIPQQSIEKEKYESLKNQYKTPSNCKILGVPKVNQEIWNQLPMSVKTSDLKLQFIQQPISKAMLALLEIVKTSAPKGSECSGLMKNAVDAASFLGLAMRELNTRRRNDIKSVLSPEFADICSGRIAVTEYLFGDQIVEELKQVKKAFNVVASSSKRVSVEPSRRFHPYRKPSATPANSLNFRGRIPRGRGSRGHRMTRRTTQGNHQ